jgi:hypothetical protein
MYNKMGIDNVARNIETPKAVYWSVKKGNGDDDYNESSNEDGQALTLTTQLKE